MKLFKKKVENKRSIDDVLTPKNVDDNVVENVGDGVGDIIDDVANESEKDADMTPKNKSINATISLNPLDCFGMQEDKTERWMLKCVKVWYYIISFVWFIFGATTFAPIIFIGGKLNVMLNDRKKSLLCGAAIYIVLIALIIIIFATRQTPPEIINP